MGKTPQQNFRLTRIGPGLEIPCNISATLFCFLARSCVCCYLKNTWLLLWKTQREKERKVNLSGRGKGRRDARRRSRHVLWHMTDTEETEGKFFKVVSKTKDRRQRCRRHHKQMIRWCTCIPRRQSSMVATWCWANQKALTTSTLAIRYRRQEEWRQGGVKVK